MYYDEVATSVDIVDGVVSFTNYTDNLIDRAFGVRENLTLSYMDKIWGRDFNLGRCKDKILNR